MSIFDLKADYKHGWNGPAKKGESALANALRGDLGNNEVNRVIGVDEAIDNFQIEHPCIRGREIYYLFANIHGDVGGCLKNITLN